MGRSGFQAAYSSVRDRGITDLTTSMDTWIIISTIARAITEASPHAESVRLSTVLSSTALQCTTFMATKHLAGTDNVT
jgi:hypothetical protein